MLKLSENLSESDNTLVIEGWTEYIQVAYLTIKHKKTWGLIFINYLFYLVTHSRWRNFLKQLLNFLSLKLYYFNIDSIYCLAAKLMRAIKNIKFITYFLILMTYLYFRSNFSYWWDISISICRIVTFGWRRQYIRYKW